MSEIIEATSLPFETRQTYDIPTVVFHWLTVGLVLILFGTAFTWNFIVPGDKYWEPLLQSVHASLGVMFTAVILGRIAWRLSGGRRLAARPGFNGLVSRLMHRLLYVLLTIQIVLGYAQRWLEGETVSFFGLFSVPALLGTNEGLQHLVGRLHNWTGWTIVILALGHAGAALVHHYLLKDGTLMRMLPGLPASKARPV